MGMEGFKMQNNSEGIRPIMTVEEAKAFMVKVRGIDETLLPPDLLEMKDVAWDVINKATEDTEDSAIIDPFARGGDRMDNRPTLQ